ncbi:hypothetical protein, partial [Vibrio sp. V34_P3A8T189]|uniref:hypothetical protein n=1 Tax=Vibrio sp. V34_P3A8T189 TaxID=1938686 RepID=UPI001F30B7E7
LSETHSPISYLYITKIKHSVFILKPVFLIENHLEKGTAFFPSKKNNILYNIISKITVNETTKY